MTGNVIPAKGKAHPACMPNFDIDGMVFIGSFNFDPRSANLNSEVGLVVESEQAQNDISQALNQYLPQIAYQLKLNERNEIIWLDLINGMVSVKEHKTGGHYRFQRHESGVLPAG